MRFESKLRLWPGFHLDELAALFQRPMSDFWGNRTREQRKEALGMLLPQDKFLATPMTHCCSMLQVHCVSKSSTPSYQYIENIVFSELIFEIFYYHILQKNGDKN